MPDLSVRLSAQRCRWLSSLLLTLSACIAAPPVAAQERDGAASGVFDQLSAAGLEVLVNGRLEGSAFMIDPSGLAVTACHVVWPSVHEDGRIEVHSPTLGRIRATLLAIDRGHDLALLQLPFSDDPTGYPALTLAPDMPEPGDPCWLYGAPMFRHGVMLPGTIAREQPTYEYQSTGTLYNRVVHIAGHAPQGMSGGPWVDQQGRVISVQSGYISLQGGALGVVFGPPVDAIAELVRNRRSARTPTLLCAFEELWEQPSSVIGRWPDGTTGVLPAMVVPESNAARAGLSRSTLVTAADGEAITTRDDLLNAIRRRRPGSVIELTVLRPGGAEEDLLIPLAMLEAGFQGPPTTRSTSTP